MIYTIPGVTEVKNASSELYSGGCSGGRHPRIEEEKGYEQRMLASEAYFYLGQHDLIVGDKQSAKSHFEKAREQGVIADDEHLAAGFELQRLNNEAVTDLVAPGLSKPAAAAP